MKIGLFTTLYNDNSRKLNLLFDANKMLVARYESMDWNGNGVIDSGKEEGYFDPWYKAIYTSWLDDWQDAQSGYWGGWFETDTGDMLKSPDLSLTFHNISYQHGKVGLWPAIFIEWNPAYPC